MIHQSSSPPPIKGIDETVSRYSNKVNYSALKGTKIESGIQSENIIRQKYRKYGLRKMEGSYMKEGKDSGKNGNLMRSGDETKPK